MGEESAERSQHRGVKLDQSGSARGETEGGLRVCKGFCGHPKELILLGAAGEGVY